MALVNLRPKVSYGSGPTVFNFTLPLMPWELKQVTKGGYGKSSTGVPESLIIRRERWLTTTLRFYDSEKSNVLDWMEYVIDNAASFNFWLDQNDATTNYLVYLEKPHMTDDVEFKRDENYLGAWKTEITVTTVAGARFTTSIIP